MVRKAQGKFWHNTKKEALRFARIARENDKDNKFNVTVKKDVVNKRIAKIALGGKNKGKGGLGWYVIITRK